MSDAALDCRRSMTVGFTHGRPPQRPHIRACCVAAACLTLAACSGADLSLPPRPKAASPEAASPEAASTEAARVDAGAETFPDLREVPRRPRLTYDLTQEREIRDELAADRDNARYEGQALRRDAGLRRAPPDPAMPVPAPLRAPEIEISEVPDLTTVYVEEAIKQDEDDGSLGDFLDTLERGHAAAVASPAPAAPTGAESVAEAEPAAGGAVEEADWPAVSEPFAVAFAQGSAVVSAAMAKELRAFAFRLQQSGRGALLRAEGDPPVLALDRARAVAIRLVQQGVPGNWIDIETGGMGERVVVYPGTGDG